MQKILGLFLLFMGFVGSGHATQLTGTLKNPDQSGFTGTLYLSISKQSSVSTGNSSAGVACGGPMLVVPTNSITISVSNGTATWPIVYGSDCMLPTPVPYNAVLKDGNGNTLFSTQWLIYGTTQDVGTIYTIPPTVPTSNLVIGPQGPPGCLVGSNCQTIISTTPTTSQTVIQPANTNLNVVTSGTGSLESNGNPVFTIAGGAISGPVSAPTVVSNGQQVVGTPSTQTIQSTVTAAQTNSGSVVVPAYIPPSEMSYPGTELTQGPATYSYANYTTAPVQDLRPLNHDVSLSQMINLPALDEEMEGGDTLRASKCAQAGACTVVLVGNSIHENINGVAPNDGYATGLLAALQRKFPSVTFNFQNLSIGGTTVENFLDSTYLCETSGTNTFYRTTPGNWYVEGGTTTSTLQWISGPPYTQWPSGCTIGQSWMQNVLAANPDMVIFGFVENDIGEGPGIFAAHMQLAISQTQLQSGSPNRTIILTTDEPPNPNWYSIVAYDPSLSESVNEAERGLAIQNNLMLADADRYYSVLTYGIDPGRRHYQVENYFENYPTGWNAYPGINGTMPPITNASQNNANLTFSAGTATIVQRTRSAIDVTIAASFNGLTTASVPSIWYRMNNTGVGYKVQVIVGTNGSNSTYNVYLYYSTGSTGAQNLISTGVCTFPTGTALALTVSAVGAKHDIWCNTPSVNNYTHVISAWDYSNLLAGTVSFGIQVGYGSVGNEYVYYGNPTQYFTPLVSIPSMLGLQVPPGFGGNYSGVGDYETNPYSFGGDGVHHPNAVGMDTYYLAAFRPVIDQLARSMESHSVYQVSHTGWSGPFGGIQDGQAGTVDFVNGPAGFRFVNNAGNAVIASGDNTTTNPWIFFKPITGTLVSPTINTSIVNGTGYQIVTAAGCATQATFGGYCTATLTLPVTETTGYSVHGCVVSGTDGGGIPIPYGFTTTGFSVHEFSTGLAGSTSDILTCEVTH